MTKKEIEIKVDVMRQFELLRRSTFKDPLCFLDEDVQNADRSKAKNVQITYDGTTLTIENDGSILVDPEVLFTMGKSGWDDEVKESENPFGMGFFSNIPASNFIEIFSGNHRVVFDERETLTIYSEESDDYYDGFKLILHNFKMQNVYEWHIRERVELLGKHIHHMNIFYNGNEIEKKTLTQGEGLPFELSIEDDALFIGWIGFTNSIFSDSKIKIFYKGRYVTSIDDFYYAKGEIHINDKALNLQSPDRKDIIKDEKYYAFKKHLSTYISQLAEIAILSGSEEDVVKYEKAIEHHVNIDSIRYRIPFRVFDGKVNEDVDYLSGIALAIAKDENIKTIGEYEVYLRNEAEEKEKAIEQEKEFMVSFEFEEEPVENEEEIDEDDEIEEESSYSSPSYSRPHGGSNTRKEKKPDVKTVRSGKKLYLKEENEESVFWLKLEELNKYGKRVELIKQYGIRLIVAQNKIEENALERSNQANIYHIGQLEEKVTIRSNISNLELTPKETRASMLLDMISRMYGFEKNAFQIGNVMVTKFIEVPRLNLSFEKIEEKVTVVANKEEHIVYVDRSIIEDSMLSEHTNEEIELNDYKFILLHLKSIIQEIGLLNGKEKKEELYEKTLLALAIA